MNSKRLHIRAMYIPLVIVLALLFSSCLKDREPTAPVEIKRPLFKTTAPSAGVLNFSVNGSIQLAFSESMNLTTFNGRLVLKDFSGNIVETNITQIDTVVLFTPKSVLQKATLYYAELRGRVRDTHNNSIEVRNEGVFDDTTLIASTWFYTEGNYSSGGFYPIFLRDRKAGSVRLISNIDSVLSTFSGFSAPEGMALSTDEQYVLVSNTSKNQVLILNSTTGNTEATIAVSVHPAAIVVNGNYAYVTCVNGKAICKINVSAKSLESTFALSFYPGKLAISSDGSVLYTLDQVSRALYLINAANGTVIKSFANAVAKIVNGEIVIDKSTDRLYICDSKGYLLTTLAKNGSGIETAVSFGSKEPVEVAITDTYLFVAAGTSMYQYNKSTYELVKTLTFPTTVKSLAIIPTSELIYVTLATSIAIVDENTFTILKEKDLVSSGIESIISGASKR